MKKICPLCGNEFDTVTGRRIVCLTCEEAIYKKQQYFLQTKQRAAYCVVCGKPLHGNQKIACSKECSQIVANIRQRKYHEKEKAKMIPKPPTLVKPVRSMENLDHDVKEARKKFGFEYGHYMAAKREGRL